jgi:hypothetical protein
MEDIDDDGFITVYQTPTNAQLATQRLERKLDFLRSNAYNRGNYQMVQEIEECLLLLKIIIK